jgi:predicted nuclease of restriction endonuclease-like (RecB) superfamily
MDVLTKANVTDEAGFAEVVGLIAAARQRAFQAVNTTLIDLYWQVGEYISRKIETAEWGEGVVPQLAQYIAQTQPGQRGFTRSNLFRMKQFYETYRDSDAIVAALARQLPWTHNLIILGQSKRPEEREFYLRMAVGSGGQARAGAPVQGGALRAHRCSQPAQNVASTDRNPTQTPRAFSRMLTPSNFLACRKSTPKTISTMPCSTA